MQDVRKKGLFGASIVFAALAFSSTASAVFPNFSDCPRDNASVTTCLDIQSSSGSMDIKGFHVPLGHSLEIRGGLFFDNGPNFVPPTGTTGLFAEPVQVPGGLLGLDLPIPGNMVTATAELAGPPSSVRLELQSFRLTMPIKLRLSNPLLASSCHIGTNSNPVGLDLVTGTTNPPPPNMPISGTVGTPTPIGSAFAFIGNTNVDNSFSIPGASGCGLLGLNNLAVNLKLKLPSASGNNTIIVNNDLAVQAAVA